MLRLDEPVPTPHGWTTQGDLRVGDWVFGGDGVPTQIVGAFAVEIPQRAYRLVFDDGSSIVAADTHLWLTYDATELCALTRRDPEWRANRRRKRASRVGGRKSAAFTAAITARNSATAVAKKPVPSGTVRTTQEIRDTLRTRSGRSNHAIPIAGPIECPHHSLPVDPYVLGAWLGDGTSTASTITGVDEQIFTEIESAGWQVVPHKSRRVRCVRGLVSWLRRLEVYDNKHIPLAYARSSRDQRLALLQGLMDTDGSCRPGGTCEFTNTNERLSRDVYSLVCSLGIKASFSVGTAKLDVRVIGPKYRICFSAPFGVFRLARKVNRQNLHPRRTTRFRYIVACDPVPPEPMRCVQVAANDGMYLAGRQMVPTHNSFALLMEPTRHVHVRKFGAVIFRRTSPRITNEGGLWDESVNLYMQLGAHPNRTMLTWVFPRSRAKVQFAHLQYMRNLQDWHGSQICMLGFDELPEFDERMFWYMLSRNRSTCGIRPYVRATANPDSESWVAKLIEWWINQDTGYAIPERSGVIRWFIRIQGELHWFDDRAAAVQFGIKAGLSRTRAMRMPKSFTFIPARLEDNPTLERNNPEYRANLEALPLVDRERLLGGNWKIRPVSGLVFPRDKWQYCQQLPAGARLVRYWDKAATKDGTGARTSGVLVGLVGDGPTARVFIVDARVGRWGDLERENHIKATAHVDRQRYGWAVKTCVEREPGSGGKDSAKATIRNLAGFVVNDHPARTKKHIAWKPLASQVQAENVWIVTGPPDAPTWDYGDFISELDRLAGDPKLDERLLKDQADSASGAYNELTNAWDFIGRPLLCSGGEDPETYLEQTGRAMTDRELTELPGDLGSILRGMRETDREDRVSISSDWWR